MRTPRGFTLVEMLVAVTLLGVGVTAWIGTATLAVRIAGAASRETAAHQQARSRAERLAGGTCASLGAGAAGDVSWSIDARPNAVRSVRVVAPFAGERGMRYATYELVILC